MVDRFYGFDDGVVIRVALSFGSGADGGRRDAVLAVQAMDRAREGGWSEVTFTLSGVRSYHLTEGPRGSNHVLSDGLGVAWNDDGTVALDH
jgi:hypothetical protein